MEDRFKFVDDLSTIEVINLLTIGLSSLYMKNQVPSDIPEHGQFVDGNNTKSQQYLNQINEWTENQKMIISQKKTKAMIINYTDNHQFTTRLHLKGENIEIVNKMKILGTIINDKLSWDDNCSYIIKRVNARMQLLRGVLSFGASNQEMVYLWITFCRSVLEQSCVVWHGSLTQENENYLERTQRTFCKLILKEKYTGANAINNKPARTVREVTVRPLPKSGLSKFKQWIQDEDWTRVLGSRSPDVKAETLHNLVMNKLDKFCPQKTRRIASDDRPWYTDQLKRLDRRRRREYKKNRRSNIYKKL